MESGRQFLYVQVVILHQFGGKYYSMARDVRKIRTGNHFFEKILTFQIVTLYVFYFIYRLIYDLLVFDIGAISYANFLIYFLKIYPMIFVFPVFFYLCINRKRITLSTLFKWNLLDYLLILFGFYQVMSFFIGLVLQNNLFYLLGDTLSVLIVVFYYFLARYVFRINNEAVMKINNILIFAGVMLSLSVLIGIGWRLIGNLSFSTGGKMIFLSSGFFLANLILSSENINKQIYFKNLSCLIIVIIGIILTLERTFWIGLLIILTIIFIEGIMIRKGKRVINILFLLILFLLSMVLLFKIMPENLNLIISIIQKFYTTFSGEETTHMLDSSAHSRLIEIQMVYEHFLKNADLANWLVGFGNGAQFENTSYMILTSGSSESLIHHIHNAYVATFLFNGYIGVLILLMIFITALFYFWAYRRKIESKMMIIFYANGVTLLSSVIMLNASRDFFADPLYAYMLATISFIRNNQKIRFTNKHCKPISEISKDNSLSVMGR